MNHGNIERLKNGSDIGVIVMHKNEIRIKTLQCLFCRLQRVSIGINSDERSVGINSLYDAASMSYPPESSVYVHSSGLGDEKLQDIISQNRNMIGNLHMCLPHYSWDGLKTVAATLS